MRGQENGENCIRKSFVICTLRQVLCEIFIVSCRTVPILIILGLDGWIMSRIGIAISKHHHHRPIDRLNLLDS
jgi:hypothetical protein